MRTRNLELYFLAFSVVGRLQSNRNPRSDLRDRQLLTDFMLNHRHHLPGQSHLVSLFEHATRLARHDGIDPGARFLDETSRLLLREILVALTDSARLSESDLSEHSQRNRIVAAIEARLDRPLRVAELARHCGMSERTLRRRWTGLSSRPLVDEINRRRIERASELLLLPDISVAEVGHQVGIESPAQFSRLFRAIRKLTPTAYRRKYLGGVPRSLSGGPPFRTEFLDGDTQEYAS